MAEQEPTTVVLYHASCNDGFAAAWASHLALGDKAQYIPVQYGQPVPTLPVNSKVYILDFSYPKDTLLGMAMLSREVTVLDHHKTAQQDLAGLITGPCLENLHITFDMDHSGAWLAWNHFHPEKPVPFLIELIQDRDLWQWKLPDSKVLNAALSIVSHTFDCYNLASVSLRRESGRSMMLDYGKAILDHTKSLVEKMARKVTMREIGGHIVPTVNAPVFQSELGERLCELHPDAPFAAVWWEQEVTPWSNEPRRGTAKIVYSLRSRNGFDVSAIAKGYGGGGHAASSGFTLSRFTSIKVQNGA